MESFEVSVPSKNLLEIPDECFLHYFKNLYRCRDDFDNIENITRFYDSFQLKRDLSLFHTRFKLCARSRNELLNELFNSNKDNDKENLTRMLYIENLRSKRLIHEFYRKRINKNCLENNEFIKWIEKEIERVERLVNWPED